MLRRTDSGDQVRLDISPELGRIFETENIFVPVCLYRKTDDCFVMLRRSSVGDGGVIQMAQLQLAGIGVTDTQLNRELRTQVSDTSKSAS